MATLKDNTTEATHTHHTETHLDCHQRQVHLMND